MRKSLLLLVIPCGVMAGVPLSAKPPQKAAPEPTPAATATPAATVSPAPAPAATASYESYALVRSVLRQNGGKDAVSLPLSDVVQTVTGKSVLPIDPADPGDAAMIAKIGGVMDRILPGMNKPGSPAHVVSRTDEVAAFFEDALGAFNKADVAGGFPAVRLVDPGSGKSYYLGVTLYPAGGRDAAVRALRIDPVEAAGRFTEDGACLLVGIEHNGKIGKDIAFLNWELLDLAKLPVRVAVVFDATQADAHPPGAVLTDGRKGRD